MKYKQTELELFAVHEDAKPDREICSRRRWVEPSVWTDHMLTALEKGVRGKKMVQSGPNAFFAELGLFSLMAAWNEASQSALR